MSITTENTERASLATATVPLTTIFTPPSTCLNRVTSLFRDTLYSLAMGFDYDCAPYGITASAQPIAFSPGNQCPSGYSTEFLTSSESGTVTETRAICCPRLSLLFGTQPGVSSLTFRTYDVRISASWAKPSQGCLMELGYSTYSLTVVNGTTTRVSTRSSEYIWANSVQLVWKAADITTTASVSTSRITPGTSISPTAIPATGTPESSDGMSTSAKAAIGVVVPVVVLALLGVAAFFFWKRSRERKRTSVQHSQHNYHAVSTNGAAIIVEK